MSKVEVNTIDAQCGSTITIGSAGKTVNVPGTALTSTLVKSDDYQAADGGNLVSQCGTDITLGASGDTITLASGASQSGFGRAGSVDWQTGSIKTGTFTPVTGEGYFVNTSGGISTVNLPAGVAGSIVAISDYTRTFNSNNCTIVPNGSEKIGGVEGSAALSVNGQSATFVYVDGTEGWINVQETETSQAGAPPFIVATGGDAVVTCGDYKTHIFTGPGTYCITAVSSTPANNKVDFAVVAGGAGGGYDTGGGGGAGGVRIYSTAPGSNTPLNNYGASPNAEITVTATGYPIAVGGGGAGSTGASPATAAPGSVSTFSTVTSDGGGGAGKCSSAGATGGSGGGGGRSGGGGAAGNTPPTAPVQGFAGGAGSPAGTAGGGGGGGGTTVGAVGNPDGSSPTSLGGTGSYLADPFIGPTAPSYGDSGPTGSTRYFSGGGGGGIRCVPGNIGANNAGGAGGGGDGSRPDRVGGTAGTVNTGGGGGGGGGPGPASGGGSGIVMIRYKYQ